MDLTIGNLYTVKQHVLGSSLATSTEFDTVLATLAKGVAAQFEKFCNRKFPRLAGDTFICPANRDFVTVLRYPIESISALAQKSSEADGFVTLGAVNSVLSGIQNAAGIVQFGTQLGSHLEQVRITYTGGYFYETLEPTDGGYPTSQPSGSTALPEDIRLAWLLQLGEVWNKRDKLGLGISGKPDDQAGLATLKLIPAVEEMLRPHRRFA